MTPAERLDDLIGILRKMPSAVVAFSGGADSTLLLAAAHQALGDRVVAVTVRSCAYPQFEMEEAASFCRECSIRHKVIDFDPMEIPEFVANGPERCYYCKKAIFSGICDYARKGGYDAVLEGSNLDDDGDYRPGRKALSELGIRSPLKEAGFSKGDVRSSLRVLGLDAWRKPSGACLATRFPYGERLTREGLKRVQEAERFLFGFVPAETPLRVRSHGDVARIETDSGAFAEFARRRAEIAEGLKRIGFAYVALDLEEYRTGRMNDVL